MGNCHTVGPNEALVVSGGCCGSDSKQYVYGGWAWAWWCISDTQRATQPCFGRNKIHPLARDPPWDWGFLSSGPAKGFCPKRKRTCQSVHDKTRQQNRTSWISFAFGEAGLTRLLWKRPLRMLGPADSLERRRVLA